MTLASVGEIWREVMPVCVGRKSGGRLYDLMKPQEYGGTGGMSAERKVNANVQIRVTDSKLDGFR